jgi:hypothetical protein
MAIQHVNHLQLGKIQPNEHDKKIMQDHTFEQQIAYYVSAFDHLVPKSHISDCDYDIPLDDFFSLDRLNGHLTEIGFALNLEAIDFYNQWFEYHTASKI